jgi:hypothetical protein
MWAALVGAACDVDLEFTNQEDLQTVPMKREGSVDPVVSCGLSGLSDPLKRPAEAPR